MGISDVQTEGTAVVQRVRQFGVETVIYSGTQVAARLLAMIAVAVYARAILPEGFGLLDVALAIQSALIPLAALGLRAAAKLFWFTEDDPEAVNTTALAALVIFAAGLAVLGYGLAPALSVALSGTSANAGVFRLALWTIPPLLVRDYMAGMLRIVQRPWHYAMIAVGAAAVQAVLSAILVVVGGQGVAGVLQAGLITQMLFAGGALWLGRQTLAARFSRSLLRRMLVYGLPLVPAELVRWAMNNANRLIFALYGLLGAAGIYGIGFRAGLLVLVIVQAFELGWQPFAFSIAGREDAPRLYARAALLYVVLAGTVAAAVGLFAREITAFLAPVEYAGAVVVAPFVGLAHLLSGLGTVTAIGAYVARQTWRISAATALGAVVTLLLTALLIPSGGAIGAAAAALAGQAAIVGLLIVLTQRAYAIPFFWGRMGLAGLSAVLLSVVGLLWPGEMPLAPTLVFKGLLLALWPLWLFVLGVWRQEDWRTFRQLVRS